MMWSEKHRPTSILGMVGNEEARAGVVRWLGNWKKGGKPLLLTGPPGTGKTTMARIVSTKYEYDVVDLNASDVRSKSRINEILKPVLANVGITGRIMVFIDEVDGIHGRFDYGGVAALLELIKKSPIPIMMAANAAEGDRMDKIVKAAEHVRLRPIPPRLLRMHLRSVVKKEGAILGPGKMIRTVTKSQGDIRSLLNLAQLLVTGFQVSTEKPIPDSDAEEGVEAFFKSKSQQEAAGVLFYMQMNPRDKINAFYSSVVTAALSPYQRARMLRIISDADMMYGRILRTQNWRLLRYLNSILAQLYSPGTPVRYTKYNLPFPVLTRIRFDGKKLRELNKDMGRRLHMSGSAVASIILPYYIQMVRDKRLQPIDEFAQIISKEAAR